MRFRQRAQVACCCAARLLRYLRCPGEPGAGGQAGARLWRRPSGGGAGTEHQQPVAAGAAPAARRRSGHRAPLQHALATAQLLRAAPRRGRAAPGGRRTAPGSAANATHLDRRGLSPSLAPAPRRGRAATASIAGRRPAHSSNVHCDDGACRVCSIAGFYGSFLFSHDTPMMSAGVPAYQMVRLF